MSQDNIIQIKIEKHSVGIMGLKDITEEMKRDYAQRPDDEVVAGLLNRLSKKNYIPNSAKESYGILGTPGLIINGKVVSVGKVPPKAKLKGWFSEFKRFWRLSVERAKSNQRSANAVKLRNSKSRPLPDLEVS